MGNTFSLTQYNDSTNNEKSDVTTTIVIILLVIIVAIMGYNYYVVYNCVSKFDPESVDKSSHQTGHIMTNSAGIVSSSNNQDPDTSITTKTYNKIMERMEGHISNELKQHMDATPREPTNSQVNKHLVLNPSQQRDTSDSQPNNNRDSQPNNNHDRQPNNNRDSQPNNNRDSQPNNTSEDQPNNTSEDRLNNTSQQLEPKTKPTKCDTPDSKNMKIAIYHMNGCYHCDNIMKHKEGEKSEFEKLNDIFKDINVEVYDFELGKDAEASKYNAFPVIKFISINGEVEYKGGRSADSIAKEAVKIFYPKV